jgi:hypothetical protein
MRSPEANEDQPAGADLFMHLLIRRYTDLREDKSEHAEGIRKRATTLYEHVVSMTSVQDLISPSSIRVTRLHHDHSTNHFKRLSRLRDLQQTNFS